MFLDSGAKRAGDVERASVCVVGSGPAGVTLALDLARRGVDVIALEAGGEAVTDESQAFYRGAVVGGPYYDLAEARLRVFGGTSNHWGGYCRPIDPRDFAGSPAAGRAPWPIGADAVAPYLPRACEILAIPDDFRDEELAPGVRHWRVGFSPPVVFSQDFFDEIETSTRVRMALNAAFVGVEASGDRIVAASVRSGDVVWRVEADDFVLCMGGIETPRMLLWINEQHQRRLLADHDVIGRWWMEHPAQDHLADVLLTADLDRFKDPYGEISLALTRDLQHEHGLLDGVFRIAQPADMSYFRDLVRDLSCQAPELGSRIWEMTGRRLMCGGKLYSEWEQAPRREHRVALGGETDPFGVPRVELHWRRDPRAKRTMVESVKLLAKRMAEGGLGRLRLREWMFEEDADPPGGMLAGWHHMGGARMSASPGDGVVDADLKAHGLANLYVSGSAVFPNGGGAANPTLTIVQLSLRLSEHLASRRA
jgi:choline dehydrogenase-like flavoprotein